MHRKTKHCALCGYPMDNHRRKRHPACQGAYARVYARLHTAYNRTAQRELREITDDERREIVYHANEAALESEAVKEQIRRERAKAITEAASED